MTLGVLQWGSQTAEQRRARVAALHAEGRSLRAIAEQLGISKSQVDRDLRNGAAQPVAPAEAAAVQELSGAAEGRVSLLDCSAASIAANPPYEFLAIFQRIAHLSTHDVVKLCEESDGGTLRDALGSERSFLSAEDLDGYVDATVTSGDRVLRKAIEDKERELDQACAELERFHTIARGGGHV
jgi:Homeodomain-like domain